MASCKYWLPYMPIPDAKVFSESAPGSSTCRSDEWGIPKNPGTAGNVEITALIALVPDPIHSSLGLQFDRSLDVLTQAAAEYGYVASHFWLPWERDRKAAAQPGKKDDEGDADAKEDPGRSAEPGLLILKTSTPVPHQGADASGKKVNTSPSSRLIYLFLVGQTPAVGVNGEQLQRALSYERLLHVRHGARLTLKDTGKAEQHRQDVPAALKGTGTRHRPSHGARSTLKDTVRPEQHQAEKEEADVIGPENSGAAASLRAGLQNAIASGIAGRFFVAGGTSTGSAAETLNAPVGTDRPIQYVSFLDSSDFKQDALVSLFSEAFGDGESKGDHQPKIAVLAESGTVFGQQQSNAGQRHKADSNVVLQFPREISGFRNAQKDLESAPSNPLEGASAAPYMHLSLKDSSNNDTVPHLSPEETPFSQEAEWMAIVRELKQRNIQVIAISASNTLDELFLAKLFHRDMPDAQLAVLNSDLLFTRIGDNAAYLGVLTLDAYPLTGLSHSDTHDHLHDFPDDSSEALFNAASYVFWDGTRDGPRLTEYANAATGTSRPPPLWATAVGRDGYYPLGLVSSCASVVPAILPALPLGPLPGAGASNATTPQKQCESMPKADALGASPFPVPLVPHRTLPSFAWYVLAIACTLLCLGHALTVWTASFWSPFTHDLAVRQSDQPRRRTVYMRIGASMLFSMNFIVAWPIVAAWGLLQPGPVTILLALCTFLSGLLVIVLTFQVTRAYRSGLPPTAASTGPKNEACAENGTDEQSEAKFYPWFNRLALITCAAVPSAWMVISLQNNAGHTGSLLGLFFSYRCLYPASGVSPLSPIILILFAWYLWSTVQTMRLRFSPNSRPRLPGALGRSTLFVSDDALNTCSHAVDSCVYSNAFCLLITRQLVRRALVNHQEGGSTEAHAASVKEGDAQQRNRARGRLANRIVSSVYLVTFLVFVFLLPIRSLDQFLRGPAYHPLKYIWPNLVINPTTYNLLLSALFYPLLVIAITGAVRMLAIWTSMRHGLLEPLERSPLRYAFTRLTNVAWTTMLRQGGMLEYWRDMTRSNEAIGQMAHLQICKRAAVKGSQLEECTGLATEAPLLKHVNELIERVRPGKSRPPTPPGNETTEPNHALDDSAKYLSGKDIPLGRDRVELNLMCAIEHDYAAVAEELLTHVLLPFWKGQRLMPVEAERSDAAGAEDKGGSGNPPLSSDGESRGDLSIRLAEEFLAMRYFSVIRTVLINLRFLMTFISAAFVLSLLAWNCYPFQPRRWVDWVFTALLLGIGSAVVWVFAQMHRDPILSRLTGTAANKLDGAFYLRLLSFGAVPFLTWMASQFPGVSNTVSRVLQSGLEAAK